MTTEKFDIIVREDGARVVKRRLQEIGDTGERAVQGVNLLKRALVGIGAVLGVRQIIQFTSVWTDLNSRVVNATGSLNASGAAMDRLLAISRRTYASLESTAEIYLRNSVALNDLGYSTEQQLDLTEAMTNALVISGAKAQQAESVINALSKALMEGKLRGENWNTVLQTGGRVVEALADGMGKSVSELREMAAAGQLTSQKIFPAMVSQLEKLREEADAMPATISDALVVLRNRFIEVFGRLSEQTGFADRIVGAIDWVNQNLEQLIKVSVAVGVALAAAFSPVAISAFAGQVRGLFLLMRAHPLVALATAVIGVVTYLGLMADQLDVGIDGVTTLADVGAALGESFTAALGTISDMWGGLVEAAGGAMDALSGMFGGALAGWMDSFEGFYADVGSGISGVVRGIARTFDAIGGLLLGMFMTVKTGIEGVPGVFNAAFGMAYNWTAEWIERIVNSTISGLNRLRSIVGKDPLELVQLERKEVDEHAFEQYGKNLASAFDRGFEIQGGYLEGRVAGVFDRAAEIAQARIAAAAKAAKDGDGDPARAASGGGGGTDAKALQALTRSLESLQDALDPVAAAQRRLAEAQTTLNKARAAGLLSGEQEAQYLDRLADHYADALDPLGALNREMAEQLRLLSVVGPEREIEARMLEIAEDMRRNNIALTAEENEQLRNQLRLLRDLNTANQLQEQLLSRSVGARQEFTDRARTVAGTVGTQGFTTGDAARATSGELQNMGINVEGLQVGTDAQAAVWAEYYDSLRQMRELDLISQEDYASAARQIELARQQQSIQNATDFFGNLAALSESGNKELATIGRAAAIAEATVAGYLAVQKALAAAPPPINYAMATAVGIAAAANVAKIAGIGFQQGGYTGNGGIGQVAGVVHGQEFVANAAATRRNRAALEAMNRGADLGSGSMQVDVRIVNQIPNAEFEVRQLDDSRIEVVARRVVREETDNLTAANLGNPNSRTSKSLARNTQTVRSY